MEGQTTEKIGRMEYEADKRRIEEQEKRQDERLLKLEEGQEAIHSLIATVGKMAVSIESMAKELKRQGDDLADIKKKPAEKWEKLCWVIATAFITTVITTIVAIAIRAAGL